MAEDLGKFEKNELRSVIKFFVLQDKSSMEIHKILQDTLGEHAPGYTTVAKWVRRFKTGHRETEDEPRSGRPSSAVTTENIDKVHDMIMEDRRISLKTLLRVWGYHVSVWVS